MITIFTPTYNRAYILPILYRSLEQQTCKDFEWLIVDDGSTDNTKELIEGFVEKADFKIRYIYQINQGKHIAINTAVENCKTEFICTVDSDDILYNENSIELMLSYANRIDLKNVVAVAFPLAKMDGIDVFLNKALPFKEKITTPYELSSNYNITGEFTLLFSSEIHKEFLYPQFENEKFMKESVVYNRIFAMYKLLYIKDSVVKGEYMPDGLTAKSKNLLKNNPKGASLVYKEMMNNSLYTTQDRFSYLKSYWDYESVFNKSFFNKLRKVKSARLKFLFLKNRILNIFSKYIK